MAGPPSKGMTFVELVVVLAILAIMLGFAIPSFREFLMNYRSSVQANDLIADLSFARTEAVKLGRRVTVQATGGNWTNGWSVVSDMNRNGSIDPDETLREHEAAPEDFEIVAADSGGGSATTLSFGAAGGLVVPATATVDFAVCRPDADVNRTMAVQVFAAGRSAGRKLNISPALAVSCP
jgi:prepilin-type N-terminal cleavage/methylation domain-containing protein